MTTEVRERIESEVDEIRDWHRWPLPTPDQIGQIIEATSGGSCLAVQDDGDPGSVWPRIVYPTADDALRAAARLLDIDAGEARVRLVWAWRVTNHDDGDWWAWTDHPHQCPPFDEGWPDRALEGPAIECWEVE